VPRQADADADTPSPPEEDAEEDECTTLVVIDPEEQDRLFVEDLEDDLELGVWAIDPEEISPAAIQELADARGIIVSWDLGHITGLEVLHALRADPITRGKRIALAASNPTRRMVIQALRHGADSFVMKPYAVDEIRRRFKLPAATGTPDAPSGAAAETASDPLEAPPGD
jgi:CheY-like chemotaxis protein